ncbi:hypothetical protein B296_00028448 [Ensete ventricosum]|uniref:Uncharacterized protein n=1 Tax=Ensete ventricosum TaxID=4639 RepID=A0A426Z4Q7_ENSVE|nr:hypothetical protein B296_00028448 [Ensete ventricosum]
MERAIGSSLGGRLLEWWSSSRKEEVFGLGSVVEPCKKVRSGEVPDMTSPMVKLAWLFSFRSSFLRRGAGAFIVKGYETSVPEVLTLPVAYHAVVLRRSLRGPYGEARVVLPAIGERRPCSPYPCQVDRTMVGPPMLVSSRLQSRRVDHIVGPGVRGDGDMTARSKSVVSTFIFFIFSRRILYRYALVWIQPVVAFPRPHRYGWACNFEGCVVVAPREKLPILLDSSSRGNEQGCTGQRLHRSGLHTYRERRSSTSVSLSSINLHLLHRLCSRRRCRSLPPSISCKTNGE